jgi:MFS-type transporter involved in bile tolerance (Atg22 family)
MPINLRFGVAPQSPQGESAAAASLGLINCIAGLGGFVGPFSMGYLVTRTGSFVSGLEWLLVNLFLGGILFLYVRRSHAVAK